MFTYSFNWKFSSCEAEELCPKSFARLKLSIKVNSSPKPVLHASILSQIFSVFTRKFVVWNLILCNLCHSNPCCDWHMGERAYSFDLHNGKHNFAFLERSKWPVMKWTEQQFEKQRKVIVLLMSRCIMLATSSDRMMTWLLKFCKWKNITDENTSS